MKRTQAARQPKWSWRDGVVDPQGDYLELLYGSQDADPRTWVRAARIGPPDGRVFPAHWLVDRNTPPNRELVDATVRDLDFYLTEVGGSDPWSYARYHCGTTSNRYGYVHWANHEHSESAANQRRRRHKQAGLTTLGNTRERDSATETPMAKITAGRKAARTKALKSRAKTAEAGRSGARAAVTKTEKKLRMAVEVALRHGASESDLPFVGVKMLRECRAAVRDSN